MQNDENIIITTDTNDTKGLETFKLPTLPTQKLSALSLENDEKTQNAQKIQKARDEEVNLLSELIVYMKYSRFKDETYQHKESWKELVDRNKEMHLQKFPELRDEIEKHYLQVYSKHILPSMRSLQFGGVGIEVNPTRMYNCSYLPIDHWKAFSETMFLLLSGCGVGFSVQTHHVDKLPCIQKPNMQRNRRYLINDSIEGWADAIKVLFKSFFNGTSNIVFDFRAIRAKGTPLKTSGGVAPGSQGLKETILKLTGILEEKENGSKLTPIEVNDMVCIIADAVISGGIRRAALISLFSENDDQMFSAKAGNDWYVNHPYRCRSNNSVVLRRNELTEDKFKKTWERIFAIGTGEPGVYLTNDDNMGANPCCEISLNPNQFCNLVEINASSVETEQDFIDRCEAAAFIATLQASYTDFHYIRSLWKRTTEREMLIGVSMTGLASKSVSKEMMKKGAKAVKETNKKLSKQLGINEAYRLTTIKPSGTTSLVLNTPSGIHAAYSRYYIRRIRVNKSEVIYPKLLDIVPELIEDDFIRNHDTAVLSIPVSVENEQAVFRKDETAIQFLERVKETYENWIIPGHRKGHNRNNISATVYVKDRERTETIDWLYENREYYNGLTIFPYIETDTVYVQTPFEEIQREKFESMNEYLTSKSSQLCELFRSKGDQRFKETSYDYDLNLEPACQGGACELK